MNEENCIKKIAEIISNDWGLDLAEGYVLMDEYEETARKILNYLKEKDVAMIFY